MGSHLLAVTLHKLWTFPSFNFLICRRSTAEGLKQLKGHLQGAAPGPDREHVPSRGQLPLLSGCFSLPKPLPAPRRPESKMDGRTDRHGVVQLGAVTWATVLLPETLTPDPARRV